MSKSSMKIKISVVIPIYNTEKYIDRCVESIITQTYQHLEIILVDDGSTDSCVEKCDLYALQDSRIRVIHKKNGGLVSARKAGVRIASGDYITHVDSDDWVEEDAYKNIVEKLQAYHPDVLTYGLTKDYESGLLVRRRSEIAEGMYSLDLFWEKMNESISKSYFYCQGIVVNAVTKVIKAELMKKWQEEIDDNIRYGEDNALTYWSITHLNNIYVQQECFYHYCVHKGSMNWENGEDNYALCLRTIQNMKRANEECAVEAQTTINLIETAYYLLAIYCMEYCFESNGELIFFPDVHKGGRGILYGKGVFANRFLECVRRTDFLEIIGNVDSRDIKKIQSFSPEAYDYVILGIAEPNIIKDAINKLVYMGIPIEKIKYVEKKNITVENLPTDMQKILFSYIEDRE